jgi:hypothetical protein
MFFLAQVAYVLFSQGLRSCLDSVDEWEFDVFELERETDGLPLQVKTWIRLCLCVYV